MQPADGVKLPYRVLHLPLAFNERWTHDAINRWAGGQQQGAWLRCNRACARLLVCRREGRVSCVANPGSVNSSVQPQRPRGA